MMKVFPVLCSLNLLCLVCNCQAGDIALPRSVEQLPVDKFDTYPADAAPPHPWKLLGAEGEDVNGVISSDFESPFVGNKETGKAFVLSDNSVDAGGGDGLAIDFVPPPEGKLYMGFDFRMEAASSGSLGLELRCSWTDSSGLGLHLAFRDGEGVKLRTMEGEKTVSPALLGGNWYHIGVTWMEDGLARVVLYSEKKLKEEKDLGTFNIGKAGTLTQWRIFSGPNDGATGNWVVDNICLAGRVDAPRTAWLPFEQASTEVLRASPRKVFAYYYPIYAAGGSSKDTGLSWYVRSLLNPTLNNDKARYPAGTRTFYYPLPRPPLDAGMEGEAEAVMARSDEVRLGIDMGLDGFIVDFFSAPKDSGGQKHFNKISFSVVEAADMVDSGFKIIPAIYTGPEVNKLLSEGKIDEAAEVYASSDVFDRLQPYESLYRMDDGEMLFSMWQPERHPVLFWEKVIENLEVRGIPVAFMPQFNSRDQLEAYAPISVAMANWGPRTPIKTGWIGQAAEYPPLVIAPIAGFDVRTRGCSFWESCNLDTLLSTWQMAIEEGADWAEINTWSDYSEQALAPSTAIGFTYHDLNTYYTQWFKTGVQPTIVRDVLYYSYRTHHTAIDPGRGVEWKMQKEGGFPAPKNEIELLAFLKEPGTLEIRAGGSLYLQEAPAGITSFKVPLPAGESFTPEFVLRRGEKPIIDEPGHYTILDRVEYPNLLYHSGVLVEGMSTETE